MRISTLLKNFLRRISPTYRVCYNIQARLDNFQNLLIEMNCNNQQRLNDLQTSLINEICDIRLNYISMNNCKYNGYVDYGNEHIPQAVRDYEQLYDMEFGGYREDLNNKSLVSYGSVEVEVACFYYSFINLVGAKNILETGTFHGYSSLVIASAIKNKCSNGKLYTIDISPPRYLLKEANMDNVEIITKSSLEYEIPYDIVFDILVLDSDHKYSTIMRELIKYEKYLKEGGYILMHDSLFFDGVGMAVEQLMENQRFEVITLESPRPCP